MEDLRLDIDNLAVENVELRVRNQTNEGRITRLEKVVSDLREVLLQGKRRSMRDNPDDMKLIDIIMACMGCKHRYL